MVRLKEGIDYVRKWLGKNLSDLWQSLDKKKLGDLWQSLDKKKLGDGKPIGGRGRLTDNCFCDV